MLDKESRNRDFPSLQGRTYLNTAAEGIPPVSVLDALSQYGRDKLLGMDGRERHQAQWQEARARTAEAFGLSQDEVGICSCSSEAFNLAAAALQLREGDEVVISDLDFPAGATPWLVSTCPATVKLWRSRQGALRVEDLVPLLGPRTRLVTVSLVSFLNGFKIDLGSMIEAVRRNSGALVAVDVTQALGRIPLDLAGADLIVSSTHKWILATHGGGLVGIPKERAGAFTADVGGWFNRTDAFSDNRYESASTRQGAASFMVGMPNYPAVYAVAAALRHIQSIGVDAIDRYASPLVSHCLAGLKKLPVQILTPGEADAIAGIIAFRHQDATRIHRVLHEHNIHIMSQAGRLRVAIHGYNTASDIDRFLNVLTEAIRT
jgi:cysteine desulfurase / selenocysteine lyase